MPGIRIRLARPADHEALTRLRQALWPESSAENLSRELESILSGNTPGTLPQVVYVAEALDAAALSRSAGVLPAPSSENNRELLGFLETGLRSHAEGCDPALPAGYVEGWYVADAFRQRGIGKQLLAAAEDWARQQGCVEMASDTHPSNELSQRVHESVGFREVERAVQYRKPLR